MKTIEALEGEVEFLKKDNTEIKKRLTSIERKLFSSIEYAEPEPFKPEVNKPMLQKEFKSEYKKEWEMGVTRQGSWILIIIGGLLCLTGVGIILGLPFLIWGIVSLYKLNNKLAIVEYVKEEERNATLAEETFDYKTKAVSSSGISNSPNPIIFTNDDTVPEEAKNYIAPEKSYSAPEREAVPSKSFSFEEEIGMKWFSRIGILALVVGVGFFIKYAIDMDWINHLARIILGVVFGVSLVVYGEVMAKNKDYAKWAKTLVGGGIAITYFCVYAAYHFESYRQAIGMNQFLDLILMVGVISVAVILSLKDNSQIIAAESFFLGYVTSLLNGNFEAITLIYTLLLTTGLVIVTSYKKWPAIGLAGVVASYLMYILWNVENPKEFSYAVFVLIFYFIAFGLQSFFFSKKKELEVDNILITLANSVLFFVLFYIKIKNFYPDYCSWVTFVLAIFYLFGFFVYKNLDIQKLAKTHLYLALFFITLTVPIYFNRELVSIVWALEALILAMLYLKTNSAILKISLNLLSVFIFFKNIIYDLPSLDKMNLDNFFQSTRLISIGATIACFYIIYAIISKNKNLVNDFKAEIVSLYSWAASILLVLIVFVELGKPYPAWATILLAIIAGVFMLIGNNNGRREFYHQANILAAIVSIKLLFYDSAKLESLNAQNLINSTRLWTFGTVILIFYAICGYLKKISSKDDLKGDFYSWAASSFLVLIIFIEFGDKYPAWATVISAVMVFIFMLLGNMAKGREFYYQANMLAVIVFLKLVFFDSTNPNSFNPENIMGSVRLGVFMTVIGIFYGVYIYLKKFATDLLEEKNKISVIYSWTAMSLMLLIIFMEFGDDYLARVSIGLGLLMLIYFLVSKISIKELFYQAVIISQILFLKVLFFDTTMLKELKLSSSFLDSRFIALLLVAMFFYMVNIYIDKYKEKIEIADRALTRIYSYYATFLVFLLIVLEMKDYWISVGWSIFALILISMGFVLSRKSLRIQGIIIFTISIFKVFIYDIQGLEVIYRTISYIALGVILLTVSFIYNKYKDKLKEII